MVPFSRRGQPAIGIRVEGACLKPGIPDRPKAHERVTRQALKKLTFRRAVVAWPRLPVYPFGGQYRGLDHDRAVDSSTFGGSLD